MIQLPNGNLVGLLGGEAEQVELVVLRHGHR
jgi:hypothetical protein